MGALRVVLGPFEGLWLIDLEVHDDPERPGASFREAFHAEKMRALGLPPFQPVQWNASESRRGTLRGIHAEPWEKLIHVAHGEAFAAIVDLRPGSPTAGQVWTGRLTNAHAMFLSRGFGNAFQALSEVVVYAYLVNEHWQPGIVYPAVRWDDPDLAIDWPITDERLSLSAKDRENPSLQEYWIATTR
jgi:dTDP-4-dehydrorhamnose 3,5-epimerase